MRKNIILALALLLALPLVADEGMWLFNHPPRQILKQRYGFDPSQAWLDHLQKASVRFNSGGSGSFVSASGRRAEPPRVRSGVARGARACRETR